MLAHRSIKAIAGKYLFGTAGRRLFGSEKLELTALNEMHKSIGGKMVPFAGYELPVLYEGDKGGVVNEHVHTRSEGCAGLFDVSHMGQIYWYGTDCADFLETLVVGDIKGLGKGEGRLSILTNENGGIIDDTVITNAGDYIYMVVNGATKYGDMQHFDDQLHDYRAKNPAADVTYAYQSDRQLVALQGKGAATVLQRLLPDDVDLSKVPFMTSFVTTVAGAGHCRVTRCGYTGEDGFEISVAIEDMVSVAESLLQHPEVLPTGLGARDSLRLEAGLCLYGNDIDATTTPVEAGLVFTMGGPKSRRRQEQGFLGAEKMLKADGKLLPVKKKRVGIVGMKAPARQGADLVDDSGKKVGHITSGTFSPSLKKPLAIGYIAKGMAEAGTSVGVAVRNKVHQCEVSKMPFITTSYYKPA